MPSCCCWRRRRRKTTDSRNSGPSLEKFQSNQENKVATLFPPSPNSGSTIWYPYVLLSKVQGSVLSGPRPATLSPGRHAAPLAASPPASPRPASHLCTLPIPAAPRPLSVESQGFHAASGLCPRHPASRGPGPSALQDVSGLYPLLLSNIPLHGHDHAVIPQRVVDTQGVSTFSQ